MSGTILHLIDTGGPGGAETIFLETAERLARRGWTAVVVVPTKDWLHQALRERGLEPILLPSRRSFDVGYCADLLRLARRHNASLLQTHLLTTAVYGGMVGRLARLPVVSTFHGAVDVAKTDRTLFLKRRIIDRDGQRAVFVSQALRRELQPMLRLRRDRTRIIANGIDTDEFRPTEQRALRADLGVAPDEVLIGAVGNIRVSKDYANLLHAAAWLKAHGASFRLVIAGDTRSSGLYDDLLALRAALGLQDLVSFAGFQRDVCGFLNACDVYALSSVREGFSLTTVQAMACAVPVVATRSGGPEEIVTDGADGLLVPAADAAALGAALQRLIGDVALRRMIGERARRTAAERFSIAAMVNGYESVYGEVLGRAGAVRVSAPAADSVASPSV